MRFKATLPFGNLTAIKAVAACLEKLDTSCVVHLSEQYVNFASLRFAAKEIQVCCELIQEKIFNTYRIESVADNHILFEIGLSNLMKALNSLKQPTVVSIKLAKRGGKPCICLEARDQGVDLVHDIPVKIMRAEDIPHYGAPEVPIPQVQLELPSSRSVRAVVDRLKYMDKYCFIDGDNAGNLTLRLENDRLTVKALFTNLIPRIDAAEGEEEEEARAAGCGGRASVKVDVRRLASALNFFSQPYDSATCCLVEDCCLILHVELLPRGVGTCTYFIPVQAPVQ